MPWSKRGLDLTLLLLASPAIAVVMGAVATLILVVSKGPVLFRQKRVGLGGRTFECLKFRTMHVNAPTLVHERHVAALMRSDRPMIKLDEGDPRLIPCARLLRAVGLDELPQLFNVLCGEMSLVGPRPCTPGEYAGFTPFERRRTQGLPGLTGLWQVNGKNQTTFRKMIELDLQYLTRQSVWLDLGILFRTPLAVLSQIRDAVRRRAAAAVPTAVDAGQAHRRRSGAPRKNAVTSLWPVARVKGARRLCPPTRGCPSRRRARVAVAPPSHLRSRLIGGSRAAGD